MARFTVDSPPEKPKMRRFNVKRMPALRKKKKYWRELACLIAIGVFVPHFFNLKQWLIGSRCATHLPVQLTISAEQSLTEGIFRQESAVQNISTILRSHSGLTTITFVGGCGTGKSLAAKLISNNYADVNRHFYHWEEGIATDVEHVVSLEKMILRLIPCQEQLLIVDNLTWRHKPYVEDIHRWMLNNSGLKELNLIVIFIFNLEIYSEKDDQRIVRGDLESYRHLNRMHFVIFKSFDETDGRDYLAQLMERGMVKVDLGILDEIVESVNVKRFGLKKLANRFLAID